MPSLNGVTVRVYANEAALEEYSTLVDAEDPSIVSCWIASAKDTVFSVHYEFDPYDDWRYSCELLCDGLIMRGTVLSPKDSTFVHDKARSGGNLYPMLFSQVVETDSQEAASWEVNPSLGTIQVKIWRVSVDPISVRDWAPRKIAIDEAPIHESKKNLGGHRVKLGQPSPHATKATKNTFQYLDDRKKPYRSFIFNYRPKAILQALGHIPPSLSKPAIKRSRSPSSELAVDARLDSDTDSEAEKIKKEQQALNERKEKARKKKEAKRSGHKTKRVKREDSEIVVPIDAKGGFIDLCSD